MRPWSLYPLTLGLVPIEQEVGWAQVLVWTFWRKKKSLFSSGIPTPDRPSRSLVTTLTKLVNFVEFSSRLIG